jgi:hypothetical protein
MHKVQVGWQQHSKDQMMMVWTHISIASEVNVKVGLQGLVLKTVMRRFSLLLALPSPLKPSTNQSL